MLLRSTALLEGLRPASFCHDSVWRSCKEPCWPQAACVTVWQLTSSVQAALKALQVDFGRNPSNGRLAASLPREGREGDATTHKLVRRDEGGCGERP
jgi:hypothetical protein